MKVYVILERNWQYNDEIYYVDEEGGTAYKVFKSKEKAQRACDRANIEFMKNRDAISIMETGYGPEEIFHEPRLFEEICQKNGIPFSLDDWDYNDEWRIPDNISDNVAKELVSCLINPTYFIQEAEIE